jgi:hypothetical protein
MNPQVGDLYTYKHLSLKNKVFLLVVEVKDIYVQVEMIKNNNRDTFYIQSFVLFFEKV